MGDFGGTFALSRVVLRLLRKLDPARVEPTIDATDFANFSIRYETVRLAGHGEGSGHKLVSESVAQRLEEELANDLLAASADELASERDLGMLAAFLIDQRGEAAGYAARGWADNDRFFVALLRAYLMESLSNTLGGCC